MLKQVSRFLIFTMTLIAFIFNFTFGFGQNKVQYTNFSWKMLCSPHFKLHFHQDQGNLPDISLIWIENAYTALNKDFQFTPKERLPVIIYGDPNLFAQTNISTDIIPEGVGGFTEMFKKRIVIPFTGNYWELRHVLHHELVHGFCFSILYNQFGSSLLAGATQQIPLWFMEGTAEYLSSKWDIEADMFLMDQVINNSVPLPSVELDGYMAYKGGQSFFFYLASSRGEKLYYQFLREFKSSKSVENCIKKVYGKTVEELGKEWIQELKRNYWPEIGRREPPTINAQAVTSHRESRDNYNLRPRISPDGSKIAFFSDRKDFSNILITDRKGKILQKISQTGNSGYFETFHPFRSGLSWSPDGKELAFVTKGTGNDEIRIVNITSKKLFRKITSSLTSISSPDWSHDGTKLVFTGVEKGLSDVYTYDLTTSSLNRLTKDIACEADPRFTPDSKRIIFSVQDTSGNADSIKIPYGNAPSDLIEMELSTQIQKFLTRTPWNEKQPCISPDGKKCAFVSDRNGVDNLYIGTIDSLNNAKPLTDYIGGCSNPDWSADMITFTLFQQSGWDVWLMEKAESKLKKDTLQYTRWVESSLDTSKTLFTKVLVKDTDTASTDSSNALLSKVKNKRAESRTGIKEDPLPADSIANLKKTITSRDTSGIADTVTPSHTSKDSTLTPKDSLLSKKDSLPKLVIPPPQPYHLSFSPDIMSVGLGISTYYGYAGQWELSLSDIMGDHRITLSGDIQGDFDDYLHLYASYFYLKHKLDMGIGGFYSKDYSNASAYGDLLYRNKEYGGFFTAQYPFSLYSRIDFQVFSKRSEKVYSDTLLPPIKTTMLIPSLSFVFDNVLWGITGPVNGVRASVSTMISPPLDMIKERFISVDADLRMYFHFSKRFVWANRLFLGGSISLNDQPPARRYFLGGSENWLFYNVNLDEYEKNINTTSYSDFVTPFRGWDYVSISGSRVALLNSEFRFPFVRDITLVWPLPIQIRYISGAVFTDLGNAWNAGEEHNGIPLPDNLYGGIGFGLRANLGIFILRYDRGWPTDFRYFVDAPTNYFSLGAEF
jgi:Tol biopolymer transport system component